jgi:hypothetical protein
LFWGNYFDTILVSLVQLDAGKLYTEILNTWLWDLTFVKMVIESIMKLILCTMEAGSDWLTDMYNENPMPANGWQQCAYQPCYPVQFGDISGITTPVATTNYDNSIQSSCQWSA